MNRKPFQTVIAIACLAAGALAGYWQWKYEGLYRWLAEWQLRQFQGYEAQMTLLMTAGILIAPLLAVAGVVRLVRGASAPPALASDAAAAAGSSRGAGVAFQLWLGRWWWPLTLGVVGGFLTFWGAYYANRGRTAGDVTPVAAADFDAGRIPTKHWLAVSGNAVMDQSVSMSSSARATYFIPVVSENFDPKRGITLFLKADPDKIGDDVRGFGGRFEGMLTTDELPGMVRVEFERRETKPASGYRILELGRTPGDDIRVGRDMLVFGGLMLIGALASAAWSWRRRRRESPRAEIAVAASAPAAVDPRFRVKVILPLGVDPQPPPPKSEE